MSFITCEYRINGYQTADALRADPNWGKRVFNTPRHKVPGMSDLEVIEAAGAAEAVPQGYHLALIKEGDRIILDRRHIPTTRATNAHLDE